MDVIRTRRNIRDFSDREVPREMLDQIVEAATWHRTIATLSLGGSCA